MKKLSIPDAAAEPNRLDWFVRWVALTLVTTFLLAVSLFFQPQIIRAQNPTAAPTPIPSCRLKSGSCAWNEFDCKTEGADEWCCASQLAAANEGKVCINSSQTPAPTPQQPGCRQLKKGESCNPGAMGAGEWKCETEEEGNWCCAKNYVTDKFNLACTNITPTPTNQSSSCRKKGDGCDSNSTYGSKWFLCKTATDDWCCQSPQAATEDNHLDCTNVTPTPHKPDCRQLKKGESCKAGGMGVPSEWECQTNSGNWCCLNGPAIAAQNGLNCKNFPANIKASTSPESYHICDQIPNDLIEARANCLKCIGETGDKGIWTAVGCIKSQPTQLIQALIKLGLGAAGGVTLLTILVGGFMLTVSEGQPKRVDQAKELIVASLTGLLFIIFSVTLLQFIGWSIFKIPGFGG